MISQGKIPVVLIGAWMAMAVLLVLGYFAGRAIRRAEDPLVPEKGLSLTFLCESVVGWLDGLSSDVLQSHDYRSFVPFAGSLFLFILVANLFDLIPGLDCPTSNSDLTLGLGAISFFYFIFWGLRKSGFSYLKSFLGPLPLLAPLMLPIELAQTIFRPLSLGIRLFANMLADHLVLSIFVSLLYVVFPVLFYALIALVCFIQALIFVVLTLSYVRLAASPEH